MALQRSLAFCFLARVFFSSIERLRAATWRQPMHKSLPTMCTLREMYLRSLLMKTILDSI